jgi:histidinol dehydrogenase
LITWSDTLVDAVAMELEKQLASAERGELARQSLEAFGALILVGDSSAAADLANTFATEHLHIACAEPEKMLSKIRNAGAVFLGPFSPVAAQAIMLRGHHRLPTAAGCGIVVR